MFFVSVIDDCQGMIETMFLIIGVQVSTFEDSLFVLIGSIEYIVEQFFECCERYGFSYIIVGLEVIEVFVFVVVVFAGK